MAATPIKIAIIANASQATRELNSFSRRASSIGSAVTKAGRVAAVGFAVAGYAAIKFGSSAVAAARESAKVTAQTAQVIKTTGGVANVTAKQVAGLSTAISNKTGVDDEAIQSGANLLLTFTNVRNEVGKGNDIFNQATQTITDMAAAFGGDASSNAKMLGKALNDPTKGVSALTRVGVAFTDQQKKQITTLQDSGRTLAAQKIILGELSKEVGGSAAAQATAGDKARVALGNLQEQIGALLIPTVDAAARVLTRLAGYVSTTVIPAFQGWASTTRGKLAPVIDSVKQGFSDLMEKLAPVGAWLSEHPELIKGAAIALGIAAAAAGALAVAMVALSIATSPITLIVVGIAALGAGIYYAYKNSETFRAAVAALGQAFVQVFGWIKTNVGPTLALLPALFTAYLGAAKTIAQTYLGIIQRLWGVFGGTVTRYVTDTFKNVKNIVEGGMKVVRGVILLVTGILKGDWSKAWQGIKTILSGAWQAIRGIVSQGAAMIRAVMSAGWAAVKALTKAAWEGIKAAVSASVSGLLGIARGIPGKILGILGSLGSLLYNAGISIIQGLIDGVTDKIGDLEGLLNSVTDKIPDWKGPPKRDSKLLYKSGILIMQGLNDGLSKGSEQTKALLGRLTDQIERYVEKHVKGDKAQKAATRAALAGLKNEYRALLRNGKAQDRINEKLKAARERLRDLKQARADYAQSVKDSVISYTNVTGLDVAFNSSAIIAEMRKRLEKVRRFTAVIQDLIARGLNQTTVDQLVQAGVEGGLAYAVALQQGGSGAITELNDLQSQIDTAAGTLGNTAADDMYNAGIAAAEGLVKGLEAAAARMDKAARRLARLLVKAIKDELGIHSPSKVFEDLGKKTVLGLEVGLRDTSGVLRATTALGDLVTSSFSATPTTDLYAAASLDKGAPAKQEITIRLTADQTDQLRRGREAMADIGYAISRGEKWVAA